MKSSGILSLFQVVIIIVVTSILVTVANHHLALTNNATVAFMKHGVVGYGAVEMPSLRFPYSPARAVQYTEDMEDEDLDNLDTL